MGSCCIWPTSFAEIYPEDGRVMFRLGATHHGICLDASDVDGDLENVIYNLRQSLAGKHEYETVVDSLANLG